MRIRLMSRLGCLEQRRGNPGAAIEHHNQGIKLAEESGLSEDPCVAYCLDGLADCSQAAANFEDAEKFRRRAVVIAEARLGSEHPDTCFMKEKMNAMRQDREISLLGKEDNCKTLFDTLSEQAASGAFTPDADAGDGSGENVAVFLWEKYISNGRKDMAQNHWREAEGALRAAADRAGQFRPSDPRRCETLRLLADVLVQMGKDEEARSCCEQALTLSFRHIGPNSAESARSMQMLGDQFSRKDDFGTAKNYYQQARNAFVLSLGKSHEETKAAQEKLEQLIAKVKEERKWSGWTA
jgi:eukaryotic-like serine/threonine-protein kinase